MIKTTATGYILAALLGAALFISHCGEETRLEPKIVYVHDTTTYEANKPAPLKPDAIFYTDTLPPIHDTPWVLNDYYAKKVYARAHEDSNIKITINDTISENKIGAWSVNYKWKKPVTQITTIKETPKSMVLIGADISTASGLGVSAGYLKNNMQYGATYFIEDKSIVVSVKLGVRFR